MKTGFFISAVILLCLIVYWGTFSAPLVFDDVPYITNNPIYDRLPFFESRPSAGASGEVIKKFFSDFFDRRFVVFATFAFNFALHGLDPQGYHALNIAIHIANSLLVLALVLVLFKTPAIKLRPNDRTAEHTSFLSALMFACHPLATESVAYVTQRFTSLAALFYLSTAVSYAMFRMSCIWKIRASFYAASLAAALLAVKSKEISFSIPVVVAGLEFMFFEGGWKRRLVYPLPFFLIAGLIPLGMIDSASGGIGAIGHITRSNTDIPRAAYLVTQFSVVATYLRLLFFPINQNLDYDYPIFSSVLEPGPAASLFFISAVAGSGIYLYRVSYEKPGLRIASFGIFWFFAALSVESSFIPIEDVIFEHRTYLPSAGLFISLACCAAYSTLSLKPSLRPVSYAALAASVLLMAGAAIEKNRVWADEIRLFSDVTAKSPRKARGYEELCRAYQKKGMMQNALEACGRAVELAPDYQEAHLLFGNLFMDLRMRDRAIGEFLQVVVLDPGRVEAHFNLAVVYMDKGMLENAEAELLTVLRLDPSNSQAAAFLGYVSGRRMR